MFGALPLVLSGGDGSELRQPLGDHHCRRSGNEPASDAVYHAGGVSLFRPSAAAFFA
nr:hypothetical protein [Escherichia coli]